MNTVATQVEQPLPVAEPLERATGPVAYLTGEYPKVSHTFIAREIAALRALGVDVVTCTVRRPAAREVVGADQQEEAARTFGILDVARRPHRLFGAMVEALLKSPRGWFNALALAWRTRSPGLKAVLWQLFYFAEATVLVQHLRMVGARHIHNHFGDSSCTVAMLASEMSGIPFSFTPHGPAIFFEPMRWRLDEKVARASFVACISHFARAQTMLFSGQAHWHKLHIVHCGVIPENYGREPRSGYGKHILFVGRLAVEKGVPLLLDAVATLRGTHSDLKLTIVGDGPDRAVLEKQADDLGLKGTAYFVGYQSQTAVADYLEAADMLALPSFAEGVPVVLMEAMASRLPVVASQVAGIPELIENGVSGILTPASDGEAVARALDRLLGDALLCERMGAAGRAKVEADFAVEREAARLAEYIDDRATAALQMPHVTLAGVAGLDQ